MDGDYDNIVIDDVVIISVHTEVTFQNGRNKLPIIPESIEIKKVFLAEKNPVVRLGLIIK